MPWRTKYDPNAFMKKKGYEEAENILTSKKYGIETNLSSIKNYLKIIKNKTEDMGALSGEYLIRYEKKRNDYILNCTGVLDGFEDYVKDLERAISQCRSKKQEWNNKIYTTYWEPQLEEI
jgi:hypothetical protein